jgi:hypothetical protein
MRLLATFAGALWRPDALYPVSLFSSPPVGCTGPHHGSGTPARTNSPNSFRKLGYEMRRYVPFSSSSPPLTLRHLQGIGGRCHPGRDLVVARVMERWPCLAAGVASIPSRSLLSARRVRGGMVMQSASSAPRAEVVSASTKSTPV